jgi:hypothetical protein
MATTQELMAELNASQVSNTNDIEEKTERVRALFQGLTFGSADEAEAFYESIFSDVSYDDALTEVRKKLSDYQDNDALGSIMYETAGAAIPAIVAGFFTGGSATAATGAKLFPRLWQAAKIGMTEGGIYAFNTGEGDLGDRASRVPGGATIGALTGGAGKGVGDVVTGFGSAVIDKARRMFGKRGSKAVETEIQRLASESGKTVDEIVADVASGKLMVENVTLREAVKAMVADGGPSSARLKASFPERTKQTEAAAFDELRAGMTDIDNPNITQGMGEIIDAERVIEAGARAPYNTQKVSGELLTELRNIIKRMPKAAQLAAQEMQQRTGAAPFYKINEAGEVVFNTIPTAAQAEAIMAHSGRIAQSFSEKTMTKGLAPSAFEVQNSLRKQIDESVEGMKEIRAISALTFSKEDAFDAGLTLINKSPEQANILIQRMMDESVDPSVLAALRSGVMASIKNDVSKAGGKSAAIRKILKEDAKLKDLVEQLFPEDSLDSLVNKLEIAQGAKNIENFALTGSSTQSVGAAANRMGTGMAEDVISLGNGNPAAAARIAAVLMQKMGIGLSEKDKAKVVQVLLSTDPDEVRKALVDESALASLATGLKATLNQSAYAGTQAPAVVLAGNAGGNMSESLFSREER